MIPFLLVAKLNIQSAMYLPYTFFLWTPVSWQFLYLIYSLLINILTISLDYGWESRHDGDSDQSSDCGCDGIDYEGL